MQKRKTNPFIQSLNTAISTAAIQRGNGPAIARNVVPGLVLDAPGALDRGPRRAAVTRSSERGG